MYSLNNISLEGLGFVAGRQQGSNIALSGFLDMPGRLGKTGHDWAEETGVEPYVSAGEIFFGGRDLNLVGYVRGVDRYDTEQKRLSINTTVDGFTDLVPLVSKWGTSNVYVNGAIVCDYLNYNTLKIAIPMREPVVPMAGIVPVGEDAEFGIDGISFKSLGGYQIELSGDRRNRPEPKGEDFTVYGKEGYAITKTVAPELTLKLYIKQPTYADFKQKIDNIQALFAAPGLRNITANNDKLRSFFVTDGFTMSMLYSKANFFAGILTCKLTESGVPGSFTELVDSLGNIITDNDGNTIMVRL
jgi:hypothetical protein